MWSRWNYRRRAEADLARWQTEGWVTADGADAIRADLANAGGGIGLAQALSVLAAVLIGFGVMSFVAANWNDMSRVARLALLGTGLWASYAAAAYLYSRQLGAFGHSAVLLGASIFGASVMLISQMFHIDGNPPDGVLLWFAGTLVAGLAFRSNPALALAMVLAGLWGGMETLQREEVFWPFLAAWGAVSAALYWQRWKPGVHLSGIALSLFVITLGYLLKIDWPAHHLVVFIGAATVALAVASGRSRPDLGGLWSGMLGYGLFIAFWGLWALQFFDRTGTGTFIVLAIIALTVCLGAIWWGLTAHERGALWLGYIGFSLEILGIYFEKIGTLLGTSLFFLVAGIIVAALAGFAYRLHARRDALGLS